MRAMNAARDQNRAKSNQNPSQNQAKSNQNPSQNQAKSNPNPNPNPNHIQIQNQSKILGDNSRILIKMRILGTIPSRILVILNPRSPNFVTSWFLGRSLGPPRGPGVRVPPWCPPGWPTGCGRCSPPLGVPAWSLGAEARVPPPVAPEEGGALGTTKEVLGFIGFQDFPGRSLGFPMIS